MTLPAFLLLSALSLVAGRSYIRQEKVPLVVNNVGPYNNPAETYTYYSLPFCAPKDHTEKVDENLGNLLAGDRRKISLYEVHFLNPEEGKSLCKQTLNQNQIQLFRDAILQHYLFEMFIDSDLSVKGFIGDTAQSEAKFEGHTFNESRVFLYTHLNFRVAYNGPHIIAVNLTTDAEKRVELVFSKDIDVEFTYSVSWKYVDIDYEDRTAYHARLIIGQQDADIHWLSIVNSMVLVILLTAFLSVILLRILKKDLARYMELDEEDFDETEETGWKLLHGDAFRLPPNPMFFTALIGAGAQIFVLVLAILLLSLVGTFYPGNRGAIYTAALVLYALTAGISGYVATSMYVSMGGTRWALNATLTALIFSVPFFIIFCVVNTVAAVYESTSALQSASIMAVVVLWALITFPLTVFGAMRGKAHAKPYEAPVKTNRAQRDIPRIPFYKTLAVQLAVAGFLPFSAIYIQVHYVFAAVWGHQVYTLFGILFIAFLMLLLVTSFITVALTYFQLAAEDWRWWWRSFLTGASTGVFLYGYACFFFYYRSEMSGTLQATFFFGYMFVIAYAFALMLGAVSHFIAHKFVRYIYASLKVD